MLAWLIFGFGVKLSVVGCVSTYTQRNWKDHHNAASLRGLCVLCAHVNKGLECRLKSSHQQGAHVGVSGPCALSRVPGNGAFELRGMTAGTQAHVKSSAVLEGPNQGPR